MDMPLHVLLVLALLGTGGILIRRVRTANAPICVEVRGGGARIEFAETVGKTSVAGCAAGGVLSVLDGGQITRDVGVVVEGGSAAGDRITGSIWYCGISRVIATIL